MCVCMVRTFNIYSFIKFDVYDTALLIVVTLLYITFWEHIHFITKFVPFYQHLPIFPTHLSPWQPILPFVLMSLTFSVSLFLDVTCRWCHTVFVFLCLACSLIMVPSGFIHVVAGVSFYWDWIIFYFVYVIPHFLCPFICGRTCRLFLHLGYWE